MRFIVTGTPRSATQYTSRLLAAMDVPCSHERVLRPLADVVDVTRWWTDGEQGESSWMAWTLQSLLPEPVPVLHVVRDPWAVIDSLANRNAILRAREVPNTMIRSIADTIDAWLPEVYAHDNRVDRAAELVVGWNRRIAEHCPDRFAFCPERLDVLTVSALLRHLGTYRSPDQITRALDEVATTTNAGFTVHGTGAISNPDVARWIKQYAEDRGLRHIFAKKIQDVPDRQSPEELADAMSPDLLERVNEHARTYGYATQDAPLAVA